MSEFLDDDYQEGDVEEFDIQPRVLKKRSTIQEQQVYVEYDRLTYNIITISPKEIEPSKRRNLITKINTSSLTNRVFENKLPLSKLTIKKNQASGLLELLQHRQRHKSEFDFIFASTLEYSYIHLVCDVVSKNIHITFDSDIFKLNMASEKITEKDLEELPDYIEIYCIDKNERSRLLGKFTVSTKELFESYNVTYKCSWLPDSVDKLKNIGFLYYNDNQIISVGHDLIKKPMFTNNSELKPNLLYKQQGNVLYLQSTVQDISSYRVSDNIVLFLYQKYDPTKMLGSITLNSEQLNNYNQFEVKLNTKKEVKLLCNYLHLHTKEENASTYY